MWRSVDNGMRQFESMGACPLWNKDKLGGVGIAQITNPKPTDDEVWDWTANLTRAQKILKEKEGVASGYPAKVRNSNAFQTLVAKFNQARQKGGKPALTVTLPDFNPDQLRLDMIRASTAATRPSAPGSMATQAEPRPLSFHLTPPPGAEFQFSPNGGGSVISPDGQSVAFVAVTNGTPRLWIRPLDSLAARALQDTDGAKLPF
jgi:hypothetical protein